MLDAWSSAGFDQLLNVARDMHQPDTVQPLTADRGNGTVNLCDYGRGDTRSLGLDSLRLCQNGHAGDLGPALKGLGPGGAILIGGEVVAAERKEVVDLVVGGEKTLRLAG
jgi:hypothetical protein